MYLTSCLMLVSIQGRLLLVQLGRNVPICGLGLLVQPMLLSKLLLVVLEVPVDGKVVCFLNFVRTFVGSSFAGR